MRFIAIAPLWLGLMSSCLAAPSQIINFQDNAGQYSFNYNEPLSSRSESRSADGMTRGIYSYVDANGNLQTSEYEAGSDLGFNVKATNLPQAPMPIQETPEILAARQKHLQLLEEANKQEESEKTLQGINQSLLKTPATLSDGEMKKSNEVPQAPPEVNEQTGAKEEPPKVLNQPLENKPIENLRSSVPTPGAQIISEVHERKFVFPELEKSQIIDFPDGQARDAGSLPLAKGSAEFKGNDNMLPLPKSDGNFNPFPQGNINSLLLPKGDGNINPFPEGNVNPLHPPKGDGNFNPFPQGNINPVPLPKGDGNFNPFPQGYINPFPLPKGDGNFNPFPQGYINPFLLSKGDGNFNPFSQGNVNSLPPPKGDGNFNPFPQGYINPFPLSKGDGNFNPFSQGNVNPLHPPKGDGNFNPFPQGNINPVPLSKGDGNFNPFPQGYINPFPLPKGDGNLNSFPQGNINSLPLPKADGNFNPFSQGNINSLPFPKSDATSRPLLKGDANLNPFLKNISSQQRIDTNTMSLTKGDANFNSFLSANANFNPFLKAHNDFLSLPSIDANALPLSNMLPKLKDQPILPTDLKNNANLPKSATNLLPLLKSDAPSTTSAIPPQRIPEQRIAEPLPEQVKDTAEVAATRDSHLRTVAEAAAKSAIPVKNTPEVMAAREAHLRMAAQPGLAIVPVEFPRYTPEVQAAREAHFRAYQLAAKLAAESDVNPRILEQLLGRPGEPKLSPQRIESLAPVLLMDRSAVELNRPMGLPNSAMKSELPVARPDAPKESSTLSPDNRGIENLAEKPQLKEASKSPQTNLRLGTGITPASTSLRIPDSRLTTIDEFEQSKMKADLICGTALKVKDVNDIKPTEDQRLIIIKSGDPAPFVSTAPLPIDQSGRWKNWGFQYMSL